MSTVGPEESARSTLRYACAASCQKYMVGVLTESLPSSNRGAIQIRRLPLGRPSYGRHLIWRASGSPARTGVAIVAPSRAARAVPGSDAAEHASTLSAPP